MSKQFLGVLAAIVLVFVGILVLTGNKDDNKSSGKGGDASSLTQHVVGQGTSGVVFVEYGDFQCPFCQQYEATLEQVRAEFKDQIKFQFRNFPLQSLHPNAFAAARAAEAADLQGKFWEMHNDLYKTSNWQVWTNASDPIPFFNQYAEELGLNVDQFKKDYASSKVNDRVNADLAEGGKLGITGTPTFYIDGKKAEIANNLPAFQKAIKDAIAKKASAPQ